MTINFSNTKDFSTAVTYLINQTFCFDQYDSINMVRFFFLDECKRAAFELENVHKIKVTIGRDLLPKI